ncbi:MAG: Hemolysin transporter protein shlB [uncultured Campylobacterales bacterium]|uniref:Hemolysin transporter protein shlB n=1 Tax=uncultured Campylobacterales bacterium TaxID=352960 RepID=A0A6S6SMZ6_9BACT|nr:MAG: Hemolysin transporter protein shlB [uncultured Campylobacterales bacterium]
MLSIDSSDLSRINEQNQNILLNEKNRILHQEQNQNAKYQANNYSLKKLEKTQNTKCFNIKRIIILNNHKITNKELEPITNRYKKCLTSIEIKNLLKELTNEYIKRGFVTSYAYMKPQNLSFDAIIININENKISNITFDNNKTIKSILTFPNLENKTLNLRDIEMGLEHINALQTNDASIDLKPENFTHTKVNIKNLRKFPIHTNISLNNNGKDITGQSKGAVNISAQNLFGLHTKFDASLDGTLSQNNDKRSVSASWKYSIPFGYFLFSGGYRNFLYRSKIKGENRDFISSGKSDTHFHNLEYTIFRDAKSILKLKSGIDIKQTYNFIANELIRVSSSKLTIAHLGLNLNTNIKSSNLNLSAKINQGVDLFDPLKNSDHEHKKAQSTSYNLDVFLTSYFNLFDKQLILKNQISSQYSEHKLYTTELFSIGGLYSVRGFENLNYSGEIGIVSKNDLVLNLNKKIFGINVVLQPFIGFDGGVVEYDKNIFKYLISSSIGLSTYSKNLQTSLSIGIPMYAYDRVIEKDFSIDFSVSFSF